MNKEESLVLMGFVTAPLKDPDRYAIEVMGSVLSGTSGRLFEELRNRQSLAYALGCVQKHALDTGFFAFYVATTKDKLEASGIALTGEMNRIRGSEVPEEELESAKRELISSRRIAGQTNSFFSFNTAMDELYGLGAENVYNYEKEIEKVTSQDVKRVAEKYLDPDSYAEVVISSK
jgi:zinc protease